MLPTACLVLMVATETAVTLAPRPVDAPSAVVVAILRGVEAGRYSAGECRDLFAVPSVRPYLALAVLGENPSRSKPLMRAHADYYSTRYEDQLRAWGKAGRFDLMAEAIVVIGRGNPAFAETGCAELRDAVALLLEDRLPVAVKKEASKLKEVDADGAAKLATETGGKILTEFLKDYDRPSFPTTRTGHTLRFDAKSNPLPGTSRTACLADVIEIDTGNDHSTNFYCTRSDFCVLAHWNTGQRFCHTFIVANGRAALSNGGLSDQGDLQYAVVIADGDVDLPDHRYHTHSLVISRGDIMTHRALHGERCLFIAGGRIKGSAPGKLTNSLLVATKEIDLGDEKKEAGVRITGPTPADLGVRWFETKDVGVEVAVNDKQLVVKSIAERSAFVGHLQTGDKLLRINGKNVATADECRRAIRQALILGFAFIEVRGPAGERAKFVPLDDVNLDLK